MGRTLDACHVKAGELCPDGYNIIDRASGTVAVPAERGQALRSSSLRYPDIGDETGRGQVL